MAYVYIHHVFALPRAEARGQMAEGPRHRANYCTLYTGTVGQLDYPAALTLGGETRNQAVLAQFRQRPGSRAIFGRLRTDDCVAPRVLRKGCSTF